MLQIMIVFFINIIFLAQALLRPSFMGGFVSSPSMLDTLICQTYYNSNLLDILERLMYSPSNLTEINESTESKIPLTNLYQVDIPKDFIGILIN